MLTLRPALPQDVLLYFQWANDPAVRANSFSSDPIALETHSAWYANRLSDADCEMFVLCDGCSPVGQIRFDICDGVAEIDYSIDHSARGRGMGKALLMLGTAELVNRGIGNFRGKVKIENIASSRAFEAAGFASAETDGAIRIFVKTAGAYVD